MSHRIIPQHITSHHITSHHIAPQTTTPSHRAAISDLKRISPNTDHITTRSFKQDAMRRYMWRFMKNAYQYVSSFADFAIQLLTRAFHGSRFTGRVTSRVGSGQGELARPVRLEMFLARPDPTRPDPTRPDRTRPDPIREIYDTS